MKAVEIAEAAVSLVHYARGADQQPVALTLDGEPVAALVGLENIDLETLAVSNSATFLSLIERSRARYKSLGGLTPDDMRRRLNERAGPNG